MPFLDSQASTSKTLRSELELLQAICRVLFGSLAFLPCLFFLVPLMIFNALKNMEHMWIALLVEGLPGPESLDHR